MVQNVNAILTNGATVTVHDGPDAPYLVIDPAGDYRNTVAVMLGDSGTADELPAALRQLAQIELACAVARHRIATWTYLVSEPDDDEDDDVELGAVPARNMGNHHPLPGYHGGPVETCPTCHPAAYRQAVAAGEGDLAAIDWSASAAAARRPADHLTDPEPTRSPDGDDSSSGPVLVTTYTYRQAHPMTEQEQRAAWGDR